MSSGTMLTVRHASFRRLLDVGGQPVAEVEVHTGHPHDPELLAYFRNGPKGYQLVRVVENDADTVIDWYDNDLHQAFRDVTEQLFSGPNHTARNDRHQFASDVLEINGVRDNLDRHLPAPG